MTEIGEDLMRKLGRIEGELYNDSEKSDKERERALNNWLMDLGW